MGSSPLRSLELIEKLRQRPSEPTAPVETLPFGLAPVDQLLPDGGLPRGAVVELCSPGGLGHATAAALSVCAAAQHRGRALDLAGDEEHPWCAWVDGSGTLYAPGVLSAGVDAERLLVVRPVARSIARVAVRLATSDVFAVIVVDRCGVPGAKLVDRRTRWSTAVRRLSLAVEPSDTTVVLLSSLDEARAERLPVALRLELGRPEAERWSLRIGKERHGRLRGPQSFDLSERLAAVP